MEKNDTFVMHGTDYRNMAERILEQVGMVADIGDTDKKMALKPNPMTAKVLSNGTTIHSELPAGAIEYLQEHSLRNITIVEGSWVEDHAEDAFQATGYHQMCSQYDAPFVDLQHDTWKEYDTGRVEIKLCDKAATVDYMINMPVLKGCCWIIAACALKNSKDVILNPEKRRFHTLGLHEPITCLNTIARNDFTLVDNVCGNLDFKGGGNPVIMNRVLGLRDPMLYDALICSCMDYSVNDVSYITMVRNLSMGNTDMTHASMIYLNRATRAHSKSHMTRRVQHLVAYMAPESACSTHYGSLIHTLDRLNDMGYLGRGLPPVYIDQGYKGQGGTIGMGQCTFCFAKTLDDCPPKAVGIMKFLGNQWQQADFLKTPVP